MRWSRSPKEQSKWAHIQNPSSGLTPTRTKCATSTCTRYSLFNGGPGFPHTNAFSLMIYTDDQEQTDRYWNALLADGGEAHACGWLTDKIGLKWQVTPKFMMDVLASDDAEGRERAFNAMLTMQKLIVAELQAAYEGADAWFETVNAPTRSSVSMISRPNGQSATGISLMFAIASGMPMIVIASATAVTTWLSASHQPASTSQMMFPITEPAPAESFLVTVRPKGHSENFASLKAWIPNGIVMIKMHMTIPASA